MPRAIVGVCAKGHEDSRPHYWTEALPEACDVLNRDERGGWDESYGSCGARMRWSHREQCRQCGGLGWVVSAPQAEGGGE